MLYNICLIITLCMLYVESKRILAVFSIPSISHQVVFRPVMRELAKRGHDVTVITTDPEFPKGYAPEHLREIDVHDISYQLLAENTVKEKTKGERGNVAALQKNRFKLAAVVFEKQMKSAEVQTFINNETNTFDLLFIDALSPPSFAFSYLYGVPVIEFGSLGGLFGSFQELGIATHPLIYPLTVQQKIYNLTIWDKIIELYTHYSVIYNLDYELEKVYDDLIKNVFGPSLPNLRDLRRNTQMYFVNTYSIWDTNRPVPPNVIYLGGLHLQTEKQLPKDIQSYLDNSENGTIYVSFGTNVLPSQLSTKNMKVLTKVLSQLPYDVLWKWDTEELPGRPENVKIFKWLPQSDLLRHRKIKLFITQGGLQSTDEAITAGVPLLCIPMLGDQWFNGEQYAKHKIGISLNFEYLSEDNLKNAIDTIIHDQSYRVNVAKLRNVLQDQPQTSLERAVWWTEYVLRHGSAAHLRSPVAYMHWTEYYEIQLVLFITGILICVMLFIMFVINYVILKIKENFVKTKVNIESFLLNKSNKKE